MYRALLEGTQEPPLKRKKVSRGLWSLSRFPDLRELVLYTIRYSKDMLIAIEEILGAYEEWLDLCSPIDIVKEQSVAIIEAREGFSKIRSFLEDFLASENAPRDERSSRAINERTKY